MRDQTVSLLSAHDLTVSIHGQKILDRVNLDVEPAEIVTVVGPNGSGKTTLIRTLIGAQEPDSGRVTKTANCVIGYVPQKLNIDSTLPMTVERFLNLPRRRDGGAIINGLARVGLRDLRSRQISELSGGQLQRVLLARALLRNPTILVLDEPTQGLDQAGVADFYELISNVRAQDGCAVLMVSHDLHVVMSASDRVICLSGHVCCHGAPETVSAAPEYRALFPNGPHGALAIYRHEHDHHHHHHDHEVDHNAG